MLPDSRDLWNVIFDWFLILWGISYETVINLGNLNIIILEILKVCL